MPALRPYSRPSAYVRLDGRRWEARLVAETRAELLRQVGPTPSPAQRQLADRVAMMTLHVTLMDRRVAAGREFTDHDQRCYVAFSNGITRALGRLGLPDKPGAVPTDKPTQSLADYLAAKAAA